MWQGIYIYITVTLPHQMFQSQTCGLANSQSHWGHMYDVALLLDWRLDWNWGMMDTRDENQGKWEQREWWWFLRVKPSIGSRDGLHCLLIWRTWMLVPVQHCWHHCPMSLPEWACWGTNYLLAPRGPLIGQGSNWPQVRICQCWATLIWLTPGPPLFRKDGCFCTAAWGPLGSW